MEIPVQFTSHGKTLLGMFSVAEKEAEGKPILILCYGLNGTRTDNHRMSTLFSRKAQKAGIHMLRFDYRGLGISEDEFWHMSIRTKVEDVLAAIQFVKGCTQGSRKRIILLGFSDGARVAMDTCAVDSSIREICMWNPIFLPIPINQDSKSKMRLLYEPRTRELVFPFEGTWGGVEHLREQKYMDGIMEQYIQFTGRKIAMFCEKDVYTMQACQIFQEKNKQAVHKSDIRTVKDANHIFSHSSWVKEVMDETIDWILKEKDFGEEI